MFGGVERLCTVVTIATVGDFAWVPACFRKKVSCDYLRQLSTVFLTFPASVGQQWRFSQSKRRKPMLHPTSLGDRALGDKESTMHNGYVYIENRGSNWNTQRKA